MLVPKKKGITSTNPTSAEPSSSQQQVQHIFHQRLREHIREATRVVMEEIMREELTAFLGAEWGECSVERKGYRNGRYTPDLATTSGPIEDLEVPRDRAGEFHTHIFDCYNHYEQPVADGLTGMFVAGVSTQKVGDVAQTLMGVAPSSSAVSRLNRSLTEQFEE